LRIRSLAGSIIDTLESSFQKGQLPTEDIVGAYGMAMRKSSRAGFVPLAARPRA